MIHAAGRAEARMLTPRWGIAMIAIAALLSFVCPQAAGAKSRFDVHVDETGRRVAITYAPQRRVVEQKVRLNGTPLEDRFANAPPAGQRLVAGLDEGVRFGPNTLRVRVLYSDGKVVKRVRHFRVSDRRPLAGITGDPNLHDGVPMLLRARTAPPGASKSERRRFKRRQGDVRLRWSILDRPEGSEAELARRHAKRPRLVPDVHGIYRVALTVTRKGGQGSAKANAAPSRTAEASLLVDDSEATKAGVFVGMEPLDSTTQGNPTALRIFDGASAGSYPIGSGNGEAGPIVNLLFDRCTLAPIGDPLYINTQPVGMTELQGALIRAEDELTNTGCSLMVITAGADYGQLGQLGPALNRWTGQTGGGSFGPDTTNPFWAVWSPPGLPLTTVGEGHGVSNYPYFDGTSPAGRMAGELVPDENGNYTFRRSLAPAFGDQNTELRFSMDQNAITLPSQPQNGGGPSPAPAGTPPTCPDGSKGGGFELVVAGASGAASLDLVGIGTAQVNGQTVGNGYTFWVNSCTQQESEAWAQALQKVLGSVGTDYNDYPTMIFLQGVGNAMPTSMTSAEANALQQVAAMIGDMGGSPGAFLNNPAATTGPGYSFAGQSWPLPGGARSGTEVSSSTPGAPPAQLDGFIKPDQVSRLAPAVATAAADQLGPDFDDYRATETASALVHPATDFAPADFPNAGNQEWESAMYYLSKNVFDPILTYDPSAACYAPKMDSNWVVYDVRSMYCGGGGDPCSDPWDTYYNQINPAEPGAKYVPGNGFDEATWNEVLPQLQKEFLMVKNLNCNTRFFQTAYGTVGQEGLLKVSGMVTKVNNYIKEKFAKIQKIDAIVGDVFEIVASLANVLAVHANVKGNDFATNVFWGIQGYIDLGESLNGLGFQITSDVIGPLPPDTTATAYATLLENDLAAASGSLSTPRDQIASDWERLQTYNAAGLSVNLTDIQDAETALSYGTFDRVWHQLLPSTFVPAHLNVYSGAGSPPPYTDPTTYQCQNDPSNNLPGSTQPFLNFPADSYALHAEGATADNPSGLEAYVLAGTYYSGSFGDHFYQPIEPPDSEVLSQLFSVSADPGAANPEPITNGKATPLGINKDQFYADVIESARAASPSQVLEVAPPPQGFCPYP